MAKNVFNHADKGKNLLLEKHPTIDHLDLRISNLMTAGLSNKQISGRLGRPLSTIQRRTRRLIENGIVERKLKLNYDKLGFRRGFLHVYASKARRDSLTQQVSRIHGVLSVSAHIGTNSDMVVSFIFKDSKEILDFIEILQALEGVEKVEWSEELYQLEQKKMS